MLAEQPPLPQKRGRGRPRKTSIIKQLTEQGVDEPWLAWKLIWVANNGKPKERLEALDRIMALRGDIKDKNSGAATVVNTGPVMMIMGASKERMQALRGAIPQLSPERAEEERAARTNERLAELRAGRAIELKHSKNEFARAAKAEALKARNDEVSDVESGAVINAVEAEPDAG